MAGDRAAGSAGVGCGGVVMSVFFGFCVSRHLKRSMAVFFMGRDFCTGLDSGGAVFLMQ